MSNYVKLINNFDSLKLTTFRANIDAFIDEVNGGRADLVDALYPSRRRRWPSARTG